MTQAPCPAPPPPDEPGPYRCAGPHTWALVREAYLSGLSGPRCAARYGVGLSNLKRRAREEGWTRRDHARRLEAQRPAATPPLPDPFGVPPPDPGPAPDPIEAAGAAIDEAARRTARGDGRGAMELLKAANALVDNMAAVTAARRNMSEQARAELENDRLRLQQAENRRHADERRRDYEREAEVREVEHQALLARLRAEAPPPQAAPEPPDTPVPLDPPPRQPDPRSWQERVAAVSGKSTRRMWD